MSVGVVVISQSIVVYPTPMEWKGIVVFEPPKHV